MIAFPQLGAPTDALGIRRVLALPYPYVIFYEPMADEIMVHRVRRTRRDRVSPRTQN